MNDTFGMQFIFGQNVNVCKWGIFLKKEFGLKARIVAKINY